jgi:hypothetical protein
MALYFAAAMVGMIALLVALQIGFGALAAEEPKMINPRSLIVSAFFAAGLTFAFCPRQDDGDKQS